MNDIERLYIELKQRYGQPKGQWSLWCKRPKTESEREEVIVGAVLTQRTSWNNVERAIQNLKRAEKIRLRDIYKTAPRELIPLIRPVGFYKTKTDYLLNLARFVIEEYGSIANLKNKKTHNLRRKLLALKGVGPETADSILLYSVDKPVFVIDEYTRRLINRYQLTERVDYNYLQRLFEENLRRDFRLYQDFHALIVIDGKKQNQKP